jgi:REP element-mobilizing transposase RayT
MHSDPVAFFFTIATYGTWLPGDLRGWVEYHHGWQLPDSARELEAKAKMTEDALVLNAEARLIVESQIEETCEIRAWTLHARNCRSNHMHFIVSAFDTKPTKIREDIKSWCTRRLKERIDPNRKNCWAERGSIRFLFDENSLQRVIMYVSEAQDRKTR